ncbi:MAG TPA: T9SS type A sorting domain-containing protein [Bacteroidota bacterium]|nr:T9SS type A sorting domain-containing protein [Bacteroidota bacterium]
MRFPLYAVMMPFLLATTGSAQFRIGPDKLPAPGDRYVPMPMDTTGVVEGESGPNRTWNFLSLVSAGPATEILYLPAATTPYTTEFPHASLASVVTDGADSAYSYYSLELGRLIVQGLANHQFITRYSDTEVQLPTPLNYGDQFTDSFQSIMEGQGVAEGDDFEVHTSGTVTITYDAYGTLLLPPSRTLTVARLKFVRDVRDTTFFNGVPVFTSQTTVTSYEWLTPVDKFPVLQIAHFVIRTNTTTTVSKLVEYNTDYVTGVKPQPGTISEFRLEQNFPNPFNPTTTIGFSLPKDERVALKVFNLLGEEVVTLVDEYLPAGLYSIPFDAKHLASGTYFYRLTAGTAVQTRKLTLVR